MPVQEFYYHVPWRAGGLRPGHHPSTQAGGGYEFRGYASLLRAPDPRRFDIHASLRDPFERIVMRVHTQRSAVPVFAVADLSASMGFRRRKLEMLADFVHSLGYSAYRTGDPFAFIGCDNAVRAEFLQPLTRAKAAGQAIGIRLREFAPTGPDAWGLIDAVKFLSRSRALVFLVSDYHLPLELLNQVLDSLSHHAIVPVVMWSSAEYALPPFGFVCLRDVETGRERTLWLRPAVRMRIREAFVRHRGKLVECFDAHGIRPLFMWDNFESEAVTRHFCR